MPWEFGVMAMHPCGARFRQHVEVKDAIGSHTIAPACAQPTTHLSHVALLPVDAHCWVNHVANTEGPRECESSQIWRADRAFRFDVDAWCTFFD
jgi:hypothetical protein